MSGLLTRASEYLDDKWRKANTVGLAAQSLLNNPGLPNGGLDPVFVSSKDGADFLKGRAVGGLTMGADLMSMGTPNSGANFLLGSGMGVSGGQREDLANQLMETSRQGFPETEPLVSGDPIRRLAGLDPKSTAGLLGEMTSNPEAMVMDCLVSEGAAL